MSQIRKNLYNHVKHNVKEYYVTIHNVYQHNPKKLESLWASFSPENLRNRFGAVEQALIFQQHAWKLYLTIRGFSLVVQISVAAKKRLRVNLLLEDFFPYFIVLKISDKD